MAWWDGQPRWPAAREILLIAVLFSVYKVGRLAVAGHVSEAYHNASVVWDIERALLLVNEATLQHAVLGHQTLIRAINYYYAAVHFPATAAWLIWMYLRRPTYYRWCRQTIVALTAAGLALHLLVPLAPPRMLPGIAMVDTGRVYGPAVYRAPSDDTLANQYAAMPSLHVGWALIVAITLIVATRSRWRWCWLLHPAATLAVVVTTGNHYWLDSIVAAVLLVGILLILPRPSLSASHAASLRARMLPNGRSDHCGAAASINGLGDSPRPVGPSGNGGHPYSADPI